MDSKTLLFCTVMGCLTSCLRGETAGESQSLQRIPVESFSGTTNDGHQDSPSSSWKYWPWKFWKWGRSVLNEGLTHTSDLMQSASRRPYYHNLHSERKLKRKIKFLVKIQNYDK
ncbi:uncharacterized protein LOC123705857 [Colias croceus]|uniref:uncharacterized protein LOC123705857 n=1 Tax=Colias crocea TaxID=72248 RepID=UPI001E28080D|nr:uncharacterized protein LOC123705857 [Colias croceus]